MKRNDSDLTKGSLGKQILLFSFPLMLSNLLQVLFNMADIAVIGQFGGPLSLGCVGSTTTLVTLFTGVLIGLAGGINVLAAHYLGAKDKQAVSDTIHSAGLISLITGLVIMLMGLFLSRGILVLLHTKPELIDGAILYIRLYFLGMPALALYNFGNAVFSAAGDTGRPLRYLLIAGIVNIVLNLFFVITCDMDVAGVAAASVIAQYLSAIMVIRDLFRCNEDYALHISRLHLSHDKSIAILRLGVPCGIQYAIFQIANLFIQMGVNSFDATMVAGNSAAANADALIYDIMAAFYTACGSFMGQSYGAGKKDRMLKSYFVCLCYSFGIGTALGILLVIFGREFLSLFTPSAPIIDAGMRRLTIMGFSYGFSAFMDCTIAASRALGKSIIPTVIVIMGSCVFRVIWVYTIFAHFKTISSLYLLYFFSWNLTAFAEIIYFVIIFRRLKLRN